MRPRPRGLGKARAFGAIAFLGVPTIGRADGGVPVVPAEWWQLWDVEPGTITLLFLAGALYAGGLRVLRLRTGARRKLRREALCYGCGWTLLCVALVSPLHPWGSLLFSAHMTQHELLMVAAAPLLILGRPALVMLSALPRRLARRGLAPLRAKGGARAWEALTHPFNAWLVHGVTLWLWHVPVLFEATLDGSWMHVLQHATFLGTALLFWQAVFHGPQRRIGYGMGVLYLFTTALHSGALGALLTFASRPWYPAYHARAEAVGISALEDQQLGGVIMWIPAGMVYAIAGLALFAGWLRESDRRPVRLPAKPASFPCAPSS